MSARPTLLVRLPIVTSGTRNNSETHSDAIPPAPVSRNIRPSQTTIPATATTARIGTWRPFTVTAPQSPRTDLFGSCALPASTAGTGSPAACPVAINRPLSGTPPARAL